MKYMNIGHAQLLQDSGPPGVLRELSVADAANSVNRVQPAPVAKRQGKTREQVLAGLDRPEGCHARFLGPTPVEVPTAGACHLRLAGDSQQGVPLRIALDRSPSMVGRNDRGGADILLVDPREPHLISQQHAVFRFVCPVASPGHAGGWWEVCDLGSLNGTVVNGVQHRKTCARLAEGDKIVFGAGGQLAVGSQWKGAEEMKLTFTFHHNPETVLAGAARRREEIGFEQARAAKRSRPACDVSKHGEGDAATRGSAPRAKPHELNNGGVLRERGAAPSAPRAGHELNTRKDGGTLAPAAAARSARAAHAPTVSTAAPHAGGDRADALTWKDVPIHPRCAKGKEAEEGQERVEIANGQHAPAHPGAVTLDRRAPKPTHTNTHKRTHTQCVYIYIYIHTHVHIARRPTRTHVHIGIMRASNACKR